MAILVGIDEAGFGPILGPLVVSSSTFSVPEQLVTKDLWQVLGKSVGDKRKHLAGRLLIADSKKAYSKSAGIRHLERTVLTVLKSLGKEPATLTELVETLSPDNPDRLCDYPWYQENSGHHLSPDNGDRKIASAVFTEDMKSNGIDLLDMKSYCLDVGYYNKMMAVVKNKANVLFTATSALIKRAWDNFTTDDLHVMVDRQGGRVHYRENLLRMFENVNLKILNETQTASSYELRETGRCMRLHFVVGADDRFLAVSLASMASKYIRELLVGSINRYFAGFGTELKPTAGYWKDGLRFIEDIRKNLPHVTFNSEQLIRCR